jgi:hydroxymethylpyrimidine/phosphomethylpyrimidine kinase
MLSSAAIIEAVVSGIRRHELRHLVVDPVMVAKSGDRLLREDAVETMRQQLLPLAEVVTPNLPEAAAITGLPVGSMAERIEAGEAILAMGAGAVVVKGGHAEGDPVVDLLVQRGQIEEFTSARIRTTNDHGTGCTFSAAIAAGLGKGLSVRESVANARQFLTAALQEAPRLGHGHGPLNHFPAALPNGVR